MLSVAIIFPVWPKQFTEQTLQKFSFTLRWCGEQYMKLNHGKVLRPKMSRKPLAETFYMFDTKQRVGFLFTISYY